MFDFNPCNLDGFTMYVMNSSELVDKIFERFKFYRGVWEEDVVQAVNDAAEDFNVNINIDLTNSDRHYLISKIDEYEEMN